LDYRDSFSDIHSLSYSFIGFQSAYLATAFNPIYWNTACLVVNSGSLENENEEDKGTSYDKLAKAIGDIQASGIKVSLIDINKSDYGFKPDPENNKILFGLKGVNKVGAEVVEDIIKNRPYKSIKEFMQKCPKNKSVMISLIKAGAFDELDYEWASKACKEPRIAILAWYLMQVSEPKKRLTLQNFNGLMQKAFIPDEYNLQKQIYEFNKYLKTKKAGKYYILDEQSNNFYCKNFDGENIEVINGYPCILQTVWDKIYQKQMDVIRDWLSENQEQLLSDYNDSLFYENWLNYAEGNVSAWEMESLCFYYHPHELIDVDKLKYGITDFFSLSSESEVDYYFRRNGRDIPIYKIYKIAGTVLNKNATKSTVTLLTTEGVVNVKFSKEYFAMYNRQLSEKQDDGSKKIVEKGWFQRGNKLLISGYRREDSFVVKTYKNTNAHQLYKIVAVNGSDIQITHDRYQVQEEENE
jgi:DNA polymerase-3 subunit alpha